VLFRARWHPDRGIRRTHLGQRATVRR
jgi:hypothetical protein